jgi:hypothetical protein
MKSPFRIVSIILFALARLAQAQNTSFDKFLVPLVFFGEVHGAYGSVWKSELNVHNANNWTVQVQSRACGPGVLNGCFENPFTIPAHSSLSNPLYPGNPSPALFVSLPSDAVANVSFQLRIQDTSRQAQTWGTTIPVIRASEFRPTVRLIGVPTDRRFRINLRIYSDATAPPQATVRIFDMSNSQVLSETLVALERFTPFDTAYDPFYAELHPILDGLTEPLVGIEIEGANAPAERLWAFVSVTNNETQHVTVILP